MSIDFTNLALAIIAVFGVFGWVRGVRRVVYTTAGTFVGIVLVDALGADLVVSLGRIGIRFHPATASDVVLAGLFVFVVYAVQLIGVRMILGPGARPGNRRERFHGALLGLLNGFLVVANAMRYADPFVRATLGTQSGGWAFQVLWPHFSHPDAGTFSLSLTVTTVTITPSPLLRIYNSLPTALILLFAFLVFVFLGTLYGRVVRSRK